MFNIKKVIKSVSAAAIAVMLMGGVFAFSTQNNNPEPNMYHNGNEWVELEPGLTVGEDYICDEDMKECTGYLDPITKDFEITQEGTFVRL